MVSNRPNADKAMMMNSCYNALFYFYCNPVLDNSHIKTQFILNFHIQTSPNYNSTFILHLASNWVYGKNPLIENMRHKLKEKTFSSAKPS
jgi:hypothetical protein